MFYTKPMNNFITLGQFIIEKQADFPYAKGELSRLLRDIGIAAKIVNKEVNKAGLMDILGGAGTTNIQGESQQKLDVYANEQFISALRSGGECCIVASEENEEIIRIDTASPNKLNISSRLTHSTAHPISMLMYLSVPSFPSTGEKAPKDRQN
jgi:fructose-1,6-bisphosphatase